MEGFVREKDAISNYEVTVWVSVGGLIAIS